MNRLLKNVAWAALVALFHTGFFLLPWGQGLEMRFLDLWFNLRGEVSPPGEIVVVSMDEDSYGVLGFPLHQPWPRAAHATLLKRLASAGAKQVVFDVTFLDAGVSAEADDELAQAMRLVPTIIGADVVRGKEEHSEKQALKRPLDKFCEAARVALVGLPKDGEKVRRFLLPTRTYSRDIINDLPSLAAATCGTTNQPGPRDLIRFYGGPRTFQKYSYYQVLETEVPLPPEKLRNKIIFVGLITQTELGKAEKDSFLTPFSRVGETSGVEIHATAAANLLQGDWIRRATASAEASLLACIAGLLTLALLYARPLPGAFIVLAYVAGWATVAYSSFLRGHFVPGAVLAVLVLPLTYTKATLTNYLIARLQQLRLERAFRFYLSPEMAREVAQNPEALQLGGQEVECTAMFTDIAGFTTVAERMKPTEVGQMLNAYFTEVMDAIFDNRGTAIQFLGDGVYALWGAPAKTSDHAALCCEAALAIRAEIERFNRSGRFPPLRTRFGINTGPVLVGNLGSKRRFDFTGIGDTVNLASRVEGLNKYFGTTILITDSTRAQVSAEVVSLKIGLIRAVGKTLPVGLHTLLSEPVSDGILAKWLEAWAGFVARDWNRAEALFSAVGEQELRLAKAVDLYREQIRAHRTIPPAVEWQGEIIFTSK